MTTFQYIVDAILGALTQVIPFSEVIPRDLSRFVFHWTSPTAELELLVTLMGALVFLIFFRYDWLGLVSALLKSIVKPASLKNEVRTLDQQSVLFLLIVCIPTFFAERVILPFLRDNEWVNHPLVLTGLFIIMAALFQFSANWNKRIKGLNHLRLIDAIGIAILCFFSFHPAVPLLFTLWVGFAFANYHYEAVFKYSMLIAGIEIFARFFSLLTDTSLSQAFSTVGALNAVAVLVLAFTAFWMTLEQLQKNLSEHTFRAFKWLSFACALFYVAIYFIQ